MTHTSALFVFLGLVGGAQLPPPPPPKVAWPPGPTISCKWDGKAIHLTWEATEDAAHHLPSDVYEIQIADSGTAQASAVYATSHLNATFGLDTLLPSTTYYFSGRSHVGWAFESGRALGANTWGNLGPIVSCTTGKADAGRTKPGNAAKADDSFSFETWRISECVFRPV